MREIKFRAQEKSSDRWVYGNLQIIRLMVRGMAEKEIYKIIPAVLNIDNPAIVIPKTVGQYTGLHDKNGKEIYEGDIFKLNKFTYVVEWRTEKYCWVLKGIENNNDYFSMARICMSGAEVIGNIHTTPELLG